jgi:hypothetical protein
VLNRSRPDLLRVAIILCHGAIRSCLPAATKQHAIFQQNQFIPDSGNNTPCIMYHNQEFLQRESEKKKAGLMAGFSSQRDWAEWFLVES